MAKFEVLKTKEQVEQTEANSVAIQQAIARTEIDLDAIVMEHENKVKIYVANGNPQLASNLLQAGYKLHPSSKIFEIPLFVLSTTQPLSQVCSDLFNLEA